MGAKLPRTDLPQGFRVALYCAAAAIIIPSAWGRHSWQQGISGLYPLTADGQMCICASASRLARKEARFTETGFRESE
jgi:hypothetical protein